MSLPAPATSPQRLDRTRSVLIVVDMQESLINVMAGRDALVENVVRLSECAQILGVPVLATTQNRARLGEIVAPVQASLGAQTPTFDKMAFSCAGSKEFTDALTRLQRPQVLLCGLETHICVSQTAFDLQAQGYAVHVAPDAVSARTVERHKLGMERLRDFGILPCATEATIFEWLGTASDPAFRDVLKRVK